MIVSLKTCKRLYQCAKVPLIYRSYSKDFKNPFTRTWSVLSREVPFLGLNKKQVDLPEHADVVIIGGGFIGTAVAYWLKIRAGEGLSVVVLEKDLMVSCVKVVYQFYYAVFTKCFYHFLFSINQYRRTYH